jgi:hypothetical protein
MSNIYQAHQPSGGNDLYVKLADGDKLKGRVASEPAISVYKAGDKPRYSWVIFVREFNGRPVNKPQILTKGVSVFTGIAALTEEWGDPTSFDITIKRTGSGLNDTEYSVTPVRESKDLTKEELAEVEKINLPQAIKGKWLADFVEDGGLPTPVTDGMAQLDTIEPMPTDEDAPLDLNDLPDGF